MKILTDTQTASPDLHSLADYAGFQFFGLTALPLVQLCKQTGVVKALGATGWRSNPQQTQWTFFLDKDRQWSDGTFVKASHYHMGFQKVLQNSKNRFRNLFADVKSYEFSDSEIVFHLSRPQAFMPQLLSIANLSPATDNPQLYAGPYVAQEKNLLKSNPYFRTSEKNVVSEIQFITPDRLSKDDPFGITAFEEQDISLTCDTLFPAWRANEFKSRPDFHSERNGLFAVLTLGSLADQIPCELRRGLAAMISQKEISVLLSDDYAPIGGYEGPGSTTEDSKALSEAVYLSVAFEKFYPNREILDCLKQRLEKFNIHLNFVCEAYESRAAVTHLRFEIRKSPIGDPFLLYRAETKNPAFRQLSTKWLDYCDLVLDYQATPIEAQRRQIGQKLQNILSSEGIVFPLVEIPSFYLKKNDLRHYGFQVGAAWGWESQ